VFQSNRRLRSASRPAHPPRRKESKKSVRGKSRRRPRRAGQMPNSSSEDSGTRTIAETYLRLWEMRGLNQILRAVPAGVHVDATVVLRCRHERQAARRSQHLAVSNRSAVCSPLLWVRLPAICKATLPKRSQHGQKCGSREGMQQMLMSRASPSTSSGGSCQSHDQNRKRALAKSLRHFFAGWSRP